MAQERNYFDQFDSAPQAGPQIVVPVSPAEQRKDQLGITKTEAELVRDARKDARDQALFEERNKPTLPPGYRWGANGQAERIPGLPAEGKQGENDDAVGRIDALAAQINEVQRLFNSGPGSTRGMAGIRDYMASGDNSRFDAAAATLEELATGAFKIPGMGGQSDADAARIAASIKPNRWRFDEATDQQLSDVRRRVDKWREARGLPPMKWEQPVSLDSVIKAAEKADQDKAYTPAFIAEYRARFGEDPPPYAGSVTDDTPGNDADSMFGQGTSGINEGIGYTAGAPVDLATSALNLIPKGINYLTGANIPQIENPVGGSEWFNGGMRSIGAIQPESSDPNKQFVRRVGQSVGGSLIPVGATARTANQIGGGLLAGLSGGLGGATAQQVAPGNLPLEVAAELGTGGLFGAGWARRTRNLAQKQAEAAIPTTTQLRQQAADLYKKAEGGRVAQAAETADLAQKFKDIATAEGLLYPNGTVAEAYPKAREALRLAEGYAGGTMTPKQMGVARKSLSEAAGSLDPSERRISRAMLTEFDGWTAPYAPEFAEARKVASRYLNAEELQKAWNLAGARAGQYSGSGFENALRTEYRGLDRSNIRGTARYAEDMGNAIEDVSRGTTASNIARGIGKLAPTNVVGGGFAAGVPFMIGNAIGGPAAGIAAAAGTSTAGLFGRRVATNMGIRGAQKAELIARNGGALPPLDPSLTEDQKRVVLAMMASQLARTSQQDER